MSKKLVPCKSCEKEVAQFAKACPHCGEKHPGISNKGCGTGCLVLIIIAVLWAVIGMWMTDSDTDSTTQTAGTSISEAIALPDPLPQKIINIANRSTLNMNKHLPYKITYELIVDEGDLLTMSAKEAELLLNAVLLNAPDNDCCERDFITIYHYEFDQGLMTLQYEKEDGKISIMGMWDQNICGIKTYDQKYKEFDQKVRWLRKNVSDLAFEFILAYEAGGNLESYQTKAADLLEKWNEILGQLVPSNCFSMIPRPHSSAKGKAMSLLNAIDNSKTVRIDIKMMESDLSAMDAYQL